MDELILKSVESIIANALREDLGWQGDITSQAIGGDDISSHARIIAKEEGIIAGIEVAQMVFRSVDSQLRFAARTEDGNRVGNGDIIVEVIGPCSSILAAERTALNFLARLSGIATSTGKFVNKLHGTKAKLLDTRKTTPGWRFLEKYAVRCGGGQNHRMGLYDMVLIKENHITAAGSMSTAVTCCRDYLKKRSLEVEIEVEAKSLEEVKEAVGLAVNRILLDNMTNAEIQTCVTYVDGRALLEASGNVTLETIGEIAKTGVDFISSGALTHSPKSLDLSLLFIPDVGMR
jgi:nicotinate-nucleotide pyrophosphorylase (carboxylating)